MRALSTTILMSLLAFPAFPQGKLVETIEVRVANIDVVVRDHHGNPVTGLTKDDFELFEDGAPQTITNFYEIRRQNAAADVGDATASAAPVAPLELRQRRFVLFVDSTTLQPSAKERVLESVQKFVDERLKPEDQMMIVSWRFGLRVITPFTSDREALKRGIAALARLAPATDATHRVKLDIQYNYDLANAQAQSNLNQTTLRSYSWNEAYTDSITSIEKYAQMLVSDETALLDALRRMESTVAGLEGKKVLLFVGQTMPAHPGAELYRYAYDLFRPHLDLTLAVPTEMMTGTSGHSVGTDMEDFARTASADGVTMYAIGTAELNGEFTADNNIVVDSTEAFSRVANSASSLNMMASMTGGVAITRGMNYDVAFETIAHDLDSYYSLGYRPPNDVSDAPRKIVVKMKNRGYSVRTRQTLVLKSSDEQMTDRVIANLYADGLPGTWPVTVKTGTPQRDGKSYVIPVQVVMPATLTLLPQDGALVGGVTFYAVVGSSDGMTSDVMRRPKGLKIPPDAENMIRAKPMTYTTAIRVKPGENTLSVAVVDQVSGTMGFARATIEAR